MKKARFFSGWISVVIVGLALMAGSERARAARPIGIDISDYQSASVDWSVLKNTYGVSFGWAKISQGQRTSGGTHFAGYATSAKAAGVPIGAYHYAEINVDTGTAGATAEANYFSTRAAPYLVGGGYYLMPMLDVEGASLTGTMASLSAWVNQWCTTVSNNSAAAGYRVKPCIYTSTSSANNWMDSSVTIWTPDLAAWPWSTSYTDAQKASMAQTYTPGDGPWSTWTFWQYDDRNVAEVYTTGDGDIFNGTYAQMTNLYVITPIGPTITSQPASVIENPGTNVTFSVAATGNGTLSYQWKFNGANLASATTSHYILNNILLTNSGAYSVAVTDSRGTTLSDSAYLWVRPPLTNNPGSVVAPSGMVNWWPGDASLVDIYGTANGTPHGGFSYSAGLRGQAFHFDGSTGYMTTGAADMAVPWTVCLWVNHQNSPQASACLFENGNNSLKLEQYNNTRQVGLTVLGVADYVFSPATTIPQNTWTHMAFVGTSTGTTLYVNGVLTASLTNSIPLPRAYIGAAWIISSAKFVDFMLGSMDEIMTFNRALSATEISSIYSAGSAGLLRAADIVNCLHGGNHQFTMHLHGMTGKSYTIYSSADLINWAVAGTVVNTLGTNQFVDSTVGSHSNLFYRVSQPY